MFDFEKPNIEVVEISDDKKYGKFVVEPLERGHLLHKSSSPNLSIIFASALFLK